MIMTRMIRMRTTPHQGPATLHAPHSNSMYKQQLDTTVQKLCEFELGQWQPVQLVNSLHSVFTSSFIDAKTTSSSDWGKERLACSFPKVTQLQDRADSAGPETFQYPRRGTTRSGTFDLKITSDVQRIPFQRSAAKLFHGKALLRPQTLRMTASVESKRGNECGSRRGSRTFQNETNTNRCNTRS